MLATAIIVLVTFVILAVSILFSLSINIGKIKLGMYWVVATLGAVVLIVFRLVPASTVWSGVSKSSDINPIKILILFFSMTFISVVLDEVGLFRYFAIKAVKRAKTNQMVLFLVLYVLTSVLTVFTSNDIVILTLTPFICFFCKNTKITPLPYLVSEFAAANTWSMMLVVGNPTNIYLATSAKIKFLEYFKIMAIPTLFAGLIELFVIMLIFRNSLRKELSPQNDDFEIKDKTSVIVGVLHLIVCLVFLALSGYLDIEMWLVSAVCATSLLIFEIILGLIRKNRAQTLFSSFKRLPWQLIPFVFSMFIIVICLEHQGVSAKIGSFLGEKQCIWSYGLSSYITANLINNIPMSILFSSLPVKLSQASYYKAIYASIVGSNIGAFLTPIGALAGIMFTELTERHNVDYGFKQFIKYGTVISVPTIFIALLSLSFIL